jgi:thioester reductase-like protein
LGLPIHTDLKPMTCLFVTGITGNVGVEICRVLARSCPDASVRLLFRARDDAELDVRWRETLAAAAGSSLLTRDLPGFVPIRGDLTAPGLGLDPRTRESLLSDTTHIIHSASLTNFAAPRSMVEPVNVRGLEHLLVLARGCRQLKAFAHLSTCFTAGRRQGQILEGELEHESGFVNAYEESKYDAERIARDAMRELPLAVYRLSLLVGRNDGYVHKPGAFHYFLEKLYAGMLPLIPGTAEARFDLLPTDYAVDVLGALFLDHFEAGKTYHIAAGEHAPKTVEWLKITTDIYKADSLAWQKGAHVPPDIVDLATYKHLVDTIHTVGNKTLAHMLKVIDSLAEYPLSTKSFDRANVVGALGSRFPVPAFDSYYPAVVRSTMGADR